MLKLSITLPNNAQINLESEDAAVIDKILGTVLENVTRALLSDLSVPAQTAVTGAAAEPRVSLDPVVAAVLREDKEAEAELDASAFPGDYSPPPQSEPEPARNQEAEPEPAPLFSISAATNVPGPPETDYGTEVEYQEKPPEERAVPQWQPTDRFGDPAPQTNGFPPAAGNLAAAPNLAPAVSEQAFVDFCRAANPLGDMRRVVVAAEGASRYLNREGVDAESLGQLFDIVGWPRAHNFVQTLRNAARSKFGWLERIPGRAGHYAVTDLGRATALGK